MIRRTFSRIARMDFQMLHGAYVRPLLEYPNQVVYSGHTKDFTLIERVERAGLKSVDYITRLKMFDLFPLEYRRLRGDPILTYALFEQSLTNRFSTVDPANTRRGHREQQPLINKSKSDPANLGKSLDPAYQSGNPGIHMGMRVLNQFLSVFNISSTAPRLSAPIDYWLRTAYNLIVAIVL
ncbi:hypothetical protein T265_09446 [Opisthorchis viverrini]|uniref:Uncharacterized protein n=1 Tax=Opisthorchis viverrini TaxID=6198 RepID=A0A074Z5R0_OPIVI|nr:hypothetical protein T265_09446 [Opisthorchis viverrini]KER22471.1 hypothetical protein T265_09446 [Opisthorchis viverrini]